MKKLLLAFAQTLASLCGSRLVAVPGLNDELIDSARQLCHQLNEKQPDTSGEYKRSEVLRGLMNRHPGIRTGLLALSIEVALCSE